MSEISIKNLKNSIGKDVQINGWVYNIRSIGKIWFVIVRDGTGYVQCVVTKNDVSDKVFELESSLTQESSLKIKGIVQADTRSDSGVEILVTDIEVVHVADEYPISLKEHGVSFLMDNRHLWLRSKKQFAIMKIRQQLIRSIRNFFDDRDFVLLDSPIFTANAVEGTTTLFETDYFNRSAYLSQSGQLYQEAGAIAFGKTYCFGPVFRAEKSKTRKHLTEFWMVEPEMAYCDINQNMDIIEEFMSNVIKDTLDNCTDEFKILERDVSKLENISAPFPRISYDEAVDILTKKGHEFEYGSDFGAPDEEVLAAQFDKPVMVHSWPHETKAFYMKRDKSDKFALGVDVIAPEGYGEIVGGAQREDDYDVLVKRIEEHDLPIDAFKWYLDLRKYGSVPHSGFGLGLERLVAWVCGIDHIRQTIPFPRTMGRLEP
ncbi:asparagine--tRNA ligase [Candidatus Marinimicrobia bacterium]|nr:asparagine--tRNA ligase [Candidatus Neomarinimicrobiota bacterium]MDB3980212.1 asparagine--tRNA ligase [Candidatus Neomarinimicrobiota bacterium]MDC0594133.1 asparagine--tRNA ligase [Candidatus Neomarinimicrobiota bacterium]MDC0878461.1 asparagine--tRNA ligase [Candidatus Neomarinimicrobiota bacterium]MDC1145966.1 asparagine--tRNA ligase [Candidatus Neomarinimicrobiota bacterium]|tara:strand:- start:8619 stop:9908 length:1290 start_codon:yes stop_codon:yes gene_type:complete